MDTDPSLIKHCENPLQNQPLKVCNAIRKVEKKTKHGLAVAIIASADLHRSPPSQNFGSIGVNPCTHLRMRHFDWGGDISQIDSLPIFGEINEINGASIWNMSGSVVGSKNNGTIDPNFVSSLRSLIETWENKKLLVTSAGHNKTLSSGEYSGDCRVYPACLSNNEDGTESRNVLAVVGAEINKGEISLWVSDNSEKYLSSNMHRYFDVAAIAGGQVGDRPEHRIIGATVDKKGESHTVHLEGVSYAVPQVSAIASMMYDSFRAIDAYQIKERIIVCSQLYKGLLDAALGGLLDAECALDVPFDRLTLVDGTTSPGGGETHRGFVLGFLRHDSDGYLQEVKSLSLSRKPSDRPRRVLALHNVIDDIKNSPLFVFEREYHTNPNGSVERKEYSLDKNNLIVVFKSDIQAQGVLCVPVADIRSLVYASDKKSIPNSVGLEGEKRNDTIRIIRKNVFGGLSDLCDEGSSY